MNSTGRMTPLRFLWRLVLFVAVAGILTLCARWGFRHYYQAAYPVRYQEYVERYSRQNNLPPSLVYAVIRTESGFDPQANSHVDARGLMQVTEDTYRWIAHREGEEEPLDFDAMLDEETNIRYGTALLRLHMEEFGSVRNALCAYHTGRGNLKKWLADPKLSPNGVDVETIPSGVTGQYVGKVLEAQEMYQKLYDME